MADSLPSLAFLGAGSMGGAILRGVVASGILIDGGITATNRTAEKAQTLAQVDGVTSIALSEKPQGNADAVAGARIVLVGVKPGMVPDLLREIAPHLADDSIIVSLAAGVTLQTFAEVLGADARVIRSMPNTPSTVRKGVTGLAVGAAATPGDLALVRRLFETVGAVVEVPETQIDALGTISGSGPAYVYLLIEEFTKAAVGMGFRDADARLMAEHTFIGAAALLDASEVGPADLRRGVTSPNGTTERAIAVLQDAHLDRTFADAAAAALARSKELAAGG
ncbi:MULTISPECIES: pyrroline-5-carboxylate reductase [unclassified Microbacterium]|uniref:pyrroline-5-carboxylate reductase n=1 Tax=unclassified Microbacterium TaxID=2609290 RepID=UPI000EAA4009|nr:MULTISPECIES: pyrroline-5-carboxylate reductase [unclassified Microbacterium]MBT2484883.1 pyrroline-5-carboxylate reductase [Microbacterium sp. ISL-108]RKN67751.1 pyrroline-5-carboxylate reductase [Microbacterium sp. CGR2]